MEFPERGSAALWELPWNRTADCYTQIARARERHRVVAGRVIRIEEDDHVRLPDDVPPRLRLRKGDVVAIIETEHGLLLAPREELVNQMLDEIGSILTMEGLTLEAMMESSAEIREELARERYDLTSQP